MAKTIRERLLDVVREELRHGGEINDDTGFVEDLGMDSLDTVELLMAAEDEFNVDIPDEDAEKLTTFGAAVRYLERLQD